MEGTHCLEAPILPGRGAAGIEIGDCMEQVFDALGTPVDVQIRPSGHRILVYPNVRVWMKYDRVVQVGVCGAYAGETAEGLRLGLSREEAESLIGLGERFEEGGVVEYARLPGLGCVFELEPHARGEAGGGERETLRGLLIYPAF